MELWVEWVQPQRLAVCANGLVFLARQCQGTGQIDSHLWCRWRGCDCASQRAAGLSWVPGDLLNHAKSIECRGVVGLLGQNFLEMQSGRATLAAALQGLCETNAGIGVFGERLKDLDVKGDGLFKPRGCK